MTEFVLLQGKLYHNYRVALSGDGSCLARVVFAGLIEQVMRLPIPIKFYANVKSPDDCV